MTVVALKITVDHAHVGQTEEVARRIEALGFHLETCISEIGVLYGSAEDSAVARFREVEGVERAEPECTFHVPPMSDDIPQ